MMKVSFPAGTSTYYTSTAGRPASAYYTDEATLCEPPGVWWGAGAEALGLTGLVDAEQAEALFDHLLDPRDPLTAERATWEQAARLGRAPGRYKAAEHIEAEMLAAEPDASPERREVIRVEAGMKARTARTFIDATFSPVKSVSLLHIAAVREADLARQAGNTADAEVWGWVRAEIETAVRIANAAGMQYLADHGGYTRAGHHGGAGGTWRDAHDLTVASFFQYSTRAGDPGLHCHNLILNRVQDADGQWRSLDAACLIEAQHAAGAIAARVLEGELGQRLGVRYALRADGVCREIVGTTEQMIEAVSTRRGDINRVARPILDAYETRVGRPATRLERRLILDQVATRTRARKDVEHLETPQQRAARTEEQVMATVGTDLAAMAEGMLAASRDGAPAAEAFSPEAIIAEALVRVAERRAVWSRHQLTAEIIALLPPLGDLTPAEVRQVAEGLTDQALTMQTYGEHHGAVVGATSTYGAVSVSGSIQAHVPDADRLANGRSAYTRPGSERYATAGSRQAEDALRVAAVVQAGRYAEATAVTTWLDQRAAGGLRLTDDQRHAVETILTGGQQLSLLIGPAGTGKSRVAAVLAEAWHDPALWGEDRAPGRMVGLAVSQNAANVLAEQGMTAMNIDRWLLAQQRLADGTARPEDEAYRLSGEDIVLVDEASMANTPALDAIRNRVQAAGARWIWAGDHRQLGAIGAGGMLADLAGTARTVELAEVLRMRHGWERAASLRLREGDLTVLADYERHGRLRACPTLAHAEADAVRGWLADTLQDIPAALIVATNDQAARLSGQARDELVALGRVAADGVHLPRQGTLAGIGDIVVTRTNHRRLLDTDGRPAEAWNRDRWRVLDVRHDGALVVTGAEADDSRQVILPAGYVAASVELGYATTEYGVQGRTVHRAHLVRPPGGSAQALYVDLTRSAEHTIAYVPTRPDGAAGDGQVHDVPERTAAAVLAEALERDQADQAAAAHADEQVDYHASARTLVERYTTLADAAGATRLAETLAVLAATGEIPDSVPAAIAADDARTQLTWLLRRVELAGGDPDSTLHEAITSSSLDGARSIAQVLHGRIQAAYADRLTPTPAAAVDRVPAVDGQQRHALTDLAGLIDERRQTLGGQAAEEQPRWAVDTLGPVPSDPVERLEWEDRAGRIALHREVADHTDETVPIDRCPSAGMVEQVAIWHDAWTALGRPELTRAEAEMSDGRLLARVRAGELAETQAPAYLGPQLRKTAISRVDREHDAVIVGARAEEEADPDQRAALLADAAQAEHESRTAAIDHARLLEIDDARAQWLEANATTLAHAEAARAELRERGIDSGHEPDRVTAAEWLAAEAESRVQDDPHRPVTETDLDEQAPQVDSQGTEADAVANPMATAENTEDRAARDGGTPAAAGASDRLDHEVGWARAALVELADRRDAARRAENEQQDGRRVAWHRADQARALDQADVDVR